MNCLRNYYAISGLNMYLFWVIIYSGQNVFFNFPILQLKWEKLHCLYWIYKQTNKQIYINILIYKVISLQCLWLKKIHFSQCGLPLLTKMEILRTIIFSVVFKWCFNKMCILWYTVQSLSANILKNIYANYSLHYYSAVWCFSRLHLFDQ